MTTDIDPTFVQRCEAAAVALRQLVELGARHDTDASAVACAQCLTDELLADPEALLAVALTVEQARSAAASATDVPEAIAGRLSLVADLAREGKITTEQARQLLEMPGMDTQQIHRAVHMMLHPMTVVHPAEHMPPLGAAWTRDNWLWCGCAGPRGSCPNERCTNHKDAPR